MWSSCPPAPSYPATFSIATRRHTLPPGTPSSPSSRKPPGLSSSPALINEDPRKPNCCWSYHGHGSAAHWAELLPAAGSITLEEVEYKLLQFHFHTPSEEKIDGKSYPLVAHLVDKDAVGQLAVVAVLLKTGKENAALKPVFDHLPAKEGETVKLDVAINPADLLPANRAYYAFMGSLTTPPCSEDVHWQVLKTPVELSASQLAAFRKLYKMNARPVQPLNDRKVMAVSAN